MRLPAHARSPAGREAEAESLIRCTEGVVLPRIDRSLSDLDDGSLRAAATLLLPAEAEATVSAGGEPGRSVIGKGKLEGGPLDGARVVVPPHGPWSRRNG